MEDATPVIALMVRQTNTIARDFLLLEKRILKTRLKVPFLALGLAGPRREPPLEVGNCLAISFHPPFVGRYFESSKVRYKLDCF